MTGQISDQFLFEGESYAIAGVNGSELFDPRAYGLGPLPASTACWRGFRAFYKLEEKRLILDTVLLNCRNPKAINGIKPITKDSSPNGKENNHLRNSFFQYCYSKINIAFDFTGTILLGKDFIRSMYVHMGFQRPITYQKVLELHFENGLLTRMIDRSKEMKDRRNQDPYQNAKPKSPLEEDVKEWVEGTFSLEYDDE